jgi:hypothetical protein
LRGRAKRKKPLIHGRSDAIVDLDGLFCLSHLTDLPQALAPTRYRHTSTVWRQITGDMTMFNRTMIALTAALTFSAASAALANEIDQSPSTAQSVREWREYVGQTTGHTGNSGNAYGYGYVEQEQSGKKGHGR